MTWVIPAGARIDAELRVVDLAASVTTESLLDPFTVTYRFLDRTGAVAASGDGERESQGVYLVRPTMPSGATKGHTYLIEVTVTMTPGGAPELILVPVLVGGPVL